MSAISIDYRILAAEACQELLQIIPNPDTIDLEIHLGSVIKKIEKIFQSIPKSSNIQSSILLLSELHPQKIQTCSQLQKILALIALDLHEICKKGFEPESSQSSAINAEAMNIN